MESIFRLSAARARVVSLFSPLVEGNSNAAVLRCVLGNPVTARNLEGSHGIATGSKIDLLETGGIKSRVGLDGVGGCPVLNGMLVL